MKKLTIVLLIIMTIIIPSGMIPIVKAEELNSENEIVDNYNYEENEVVEEEDSDYTAEEEKNIEKLEKNIGKKNSIGVVLVEIFCGIIGIVMIAIAFKKNE